MDEITHNATESEAREAEARLTDMRTHEVSLVDLAANLRRFLLVKRGEMDPDTAKDEAAEVAADTEGAPPEATDEATEKAVAMPAAAKQTIMDTLAAVLERATGLAQVVGEAQIDDEATVPAEVTQMLGDVSLMLSGLADQFTAADEAEPEAEPEQPPADDEPADETEQAMDGGDDEPAATEKAGRKIAGRRLQKLVALADQLTELIRELGGIDESEATEKADAADDEKPDPISALGDTLGEVTKSLDAVASRLDEVEKSVQSKLDESDEQAEALAKANSAIEGLAASIRAPGASNVRESEGDSKPAATSWPDDMAEEVRRKRAAS